MLYDGRSHLEQLKEVFTLKRALIFMVLVVMLVVFLQGAFSMEKQNGENMSISGLPTPPGREVPKPSGTPGNLTVLDWAGFKAAVTYTYDDAQPSHIAHYDALQATGVPMTFYFSRNVNWIPNSDQLWSQAVKDGHEIGNHTVSHPYANLTGSCFGKPLESVEAEIDECTKHIVEKFGQSDVWTMAAPYGDIGWKKAAKSRYFLNRGVGGPMIAPNDNTDPLNLPCYMANTGETAEKFNGLIDKAQLNGMWLIFLFHTIKPTTDNWYAPVEIIEITNSVDHAKVLGDIWIDTLVGIGAYWMGQKIISSVTPVTSGKETIWSWTLPENFPKGKYVRVKIDGGTLKQGEKVLQWDSHGYYEVALDEGTLTLTS
jgi:hypothetical protein